ncbi:MAG: DUF1704 domain-containing protein [Candidatus Microsaccharimonas sossegonensis]|uniref:DUF1704 domain-containing protein n=1 Tax=Candidatus Microsaccharimonas sossegonensis TaxID=2506948 RepID=A0A4Q0AGG6_9BACT|nr:MAG: DUF1704 domain-containing protein [Candidatus Microsaccharimonas sossegonensis]
MSEINVLPVAEAEPQPSIEELFSQLTGMEPKPIANFVPTNAAEQKKLFLSGEVRNPDHHYSKLAAIDFESNRQKITSIGEKLSMHPDTEQKYIDVYSQFIQNYLNKTNFMELASKVKSAGTDDEIKAAKSEFMKLNLELYGKPDQATYQSLIGEKIDLIKSKNLTEVALKIRDELIELVGDRDSRVEERFKPSQETIDWVHDIADSENSLYGSMLEHVPDQASFNDEEIKSIFEEIIVKEFELQLAKSEDNNSILWQVVIEDAQSINVKAAEKKIIVPKDKELSLKEMRGRVVHEIGVHFLRSVMGEQANLEPLKLGLSEYYDTEEGLGALMEQAIVSKYREAGADHYITAGLAYYDDKDFRDIFEIKWRLHVLGTSKGDITEENITKSKGIAYGSTMRIMRGTDALPWFKDLSYYNGVAEVWKYLEEIKGDDTEFMLVLLGKANSANKDHRRILLETATV